MRESERMKEKYEKDEQVWGFPSGEVIEQAGPVAWSKDGVYIDWETNPLKKYDIDMTINGFTIMLNISCL